MDDGRATLMEAIRKAGGTEKAGLKSAKERKRRRKAKKEEDQVPAAGGGGSGGDLLGDLHAALSRRRKGISGRQDKDELPNTGMFCYFIHCMSGKFDVGFDDSIILTLAIKLISINFNFPDTPDTINYIFSNVVILSKFNYKKIVFYKDTFIACLYFLP